MGIIRAIFEGYRSVKPKHDDSIYEYLKDTPVLHSSQYLDELYQHAQTKFQEDCILEHMNRHGAWEVKSYRAIEREIIDRRWRK